MLRYVEQDCFGEERNRREQQIRMRNLWVVVALAILITIGGLFAWKQWGNRPAPAEALAQDLPMDVTAEDNILGSANAPITMIEYASLTCPHCAKFHTTILPKIKTDWIDTGKVRLVYRDFPLDGAALGAATVAHCAPRERYFAMVSLFFEKQDEWAVPEQWQEHLTKLAAIAGLDKASVDTCLADTARKDAIVKSAEDAQAKYGINSTPTFIINGVKTSGAQPVEHFVEIFQKVQPKS
jgi:protein-disulfide isomerase